jgi:hypothetical protein
MEIVLFVLVWCHDDDDAIWWAHESDVIAAAALGQHHRGWRAVTEVVVVGGITKHRGSRHHSILGTLKVQRHLDPELTEKKKEK